MSIEITKANAQYAPYPEALDWIAHHLVYRNGWEFDLRPIDRGQGSSGLTLVISVVCTDSYGARPHPRRRDP